MTAQVDNEKSINPGRKLRCLIIFLISMITVFVLATLGLTIYLVVSYETIESTSPPLAATMTPLPTWPPASNSPEGIFTKGAVAADNGVCSEIGRNVLIQGGNAVDSAIATVFCIGVMDPQSTGLGGGHFMTIYNRETRTCVAIDARETAPQAADKNMYQNNTDGSQIGYLALAVPGQLGGLWVAYREYGGGVPWHTLVQPTIDLCEKGYAVSTELAEKLMENWGIIQNESSLHIFINNATNLPYQAGDIMTRPTLGATLRQLAAAKDPIQLFYNSSLTKTIVQEIQAGGGIITEEDFRNYQVKWGENQRPVITTQLKGNSLTVCGPPPPSSASITSAILNILDGYNITPDDLNTVDSNVEVYHRLIEAMKFGYGQRDLLGDMDFVPTAMGVAKNITSPWFGALIRSKITNTSHDLNYYLPSGSSLNDHGTAHVSVLDSLGNAVSVTSTINENFGAAVRSLSTGIIWNDEMDDFSQPNKTNYYDYEPIPYNYIEPGKRPLSSMSPVVVYDSSSGDIKLVTGVAGGSRIISACAQILFRTLYFEQTIKEALDAPRLHNQLQPFDTEYEDGFPNLYVRDLEKRLHLMKHATDSSAATGILKGTDGKLYAASDYRKGGGYPSGF